jgi:hypothetical protein
MVFPCQAAFPEIGLSIQGNRSRTLPVMLVALSEAWKVSIALIGLFGVVFPALVTGLIIFAVAQAMAERQQNLERRSGRG